MKISVITPVYNAVNTLETTILSVLNQDSNVEVEYIIVDGGSTDGSLDIINRYTDRIEKVISELDNGVYDAMNKGISLSTGDIIGIINADDFYNINCLQHVERAFKEHSNAGIVYAPIDNYFSGKYRNSFIPGKLENLSVKFVLNHPSCFVRRNVYEQIGGFDLSYSISADYDFILRAYSAGVKFHYVDIPLSGYSMDGMSGKVRNRLMLIRESWAISQKLAPTLPKASQIKRIVFYISWIIKDILFIPIKKFIKPHTLGRVKQLMRKTIGRFPTDEYGAW